MTDPVSEIIPRSVWYGWGDPSRAKPVPAAAWAMLKTELGIIKRPDSTSPVPLDDVALATSRLTTAQLDSLRTIVGDDNLSVERADRIKHAGGKGYPDLRRLRDGDASAAPDAVLFPASDNEISDIFDLCAEHGITVVPFGGGTSVVGGVDARPAGNIAENPTRDSRPVITLDLRRFDSIDIDEVSHIATLGAGLRGPEADAALARRGLTLGHYPQSHQAATIGGYVATRSAGQSSTGYGRIDDMVIGTRLVTPAGVLDTGRAPASAVGPRLTDLVVGSEGALGIVTSAKLRVSIRPTTKRHSSWAFSSFHDGAKAIRELNQHLGHCMLPAVCRLSDAEETRVQLGMAGSTGKVIKGYTRARRMSDPSLGIFVWEGTDDKLLHANQKACEKIFVANGGVRLPKKIAESWEHGRFSAPYLRDELISHGVLVDTLETATTWSNFENLHDAVSQAIHNVFDELGTPAFVQAHISHVYPTGASLYYTMVAAEARDPLAQWRQMKSAASKAIIDAGGTISHHHAVGTDHVPQAHDELGALGMRALAAVKAELDPHGVLNRGKLIPLELTRTTDDSKDN